MKYHITARVGIKHAIDDDKVKMRVEQRAKTVDEDAAYCKPENKVSLGFVERLINNKIRIFQRRAYGLRDEEYLRLKVLAAMHPAI